ncbi:hypothetical protein PR202_gb12957 [Eleusine coracana subsp. coracana]|uniref:Uncharacterized protein n=1 Tax=Eleusine coracana subsp. coracana TaxID=191504 RepID=A0AAV5EP82_ELECO|nr:hypothetical protein PR202_gb12957 [Eleusine coracana subsp. coracana]
MLVTFIEKKKLPVKTLVRFSRSRIQKLILILAWMDRDDMEIRLLAAKIVAHIAGDISLAQFPGTLECLSSLLKVSEENAIFTSPLKNDTEGGTSTEEGEGIMENVIHSQERLQGQNSGRILKDRQKNVTANHDIDTKRHNIT